MLRYTVILLACMIVACGPKKKKPESFEARYQDLDFLDEEEFDDIPESVHTQSEDDDEKEGDGEEQ